MAQRRWRISRRAVALTAALALVAGCGSGGDNTDSASTAGNAPETAATVTVGATAANAPGTAATVTVGATAATAPVKAGTVTVGAILPLTGPVADLGQNSKQGIEIAVAKVNADGGLTVGGKVYDVAVVYCDTAIDAAKVVTCGRKLASQNHVKGIVTVTSIESLPLLGFNTAPGSDFVLVSSAATDKLTNSGNRYVVRYWFNTKTYMPELGKLLAEVNSKRNLGIEKIAVLHSQEEFGTAWAQNFGMAVEKAGFDAPKIASFSVGTTDYYPQLTPLVKGGTDLLAVPFTCDAVSSVVKQARELGFRGRFLFMLACEYDELKTKVSNPLDLVGSLFEGGPWSDPTKADIEFRKLLKEKYGEDVDPSASATYSQAMWFFRALEISGGTTDVPAIRAAMGAALDSSPNTFGLTDLQDNGEVTGHVHLRLVETPDKITELTHTDS